MEQSHHIIDAPEKPNKPSRHLWLGYLAIGLLALGVLMQWLHFDDWLLPVLVGVSLMTLRGGLIYFRRDQPLHSKVFFLGRAWLICGLLLLLWNRYSMWWLFVPAIALMALGWYMESRVPVAQRPKDDPEFD